MTQELYNKAKELIPGGTQLLSKRPEMFLPDHWPSYYKKAKGVDVWDLNDNHYIDMSYNGVGSCILGAADIDVDFAVINAINNGSMSTLNCPEEVELAELLCDIHPWADMVRYARTGGEAMAIAVRIARASTGREKVAFCGYHGWHDWYLSANLAENSALDGHLLPGLSPAGVPRGLLGTALPFRYNHIEELEDIVANNELAAIVMEPIRNEEPEDLFLHRVRQLATLTNAVLIFDEISSGFRICTGGAHLRLMAGVVRPDIAVFAKAMSNGYPMAAIIGRNEYMQAAQNTFISSTYWSERIGPVAALATIKKHQRLNVSDHLVHIGGLLANGLIRAANDAYLDIGVFGILPLLHFTFDDYTQESKTLFTQLMLERGFLATNSIYVTYAHTEEHVEKYIDAAEWAFSHIAHAQEGDDFDIRLNGPVAHTGFHRLT